MFRVEGTGLGMGYGEIMSLPIERKDRFLEMLSDRYDELNQTYGSAGK